MGWEEVEKGEGKWLDSSLATSSGGRRSVLDGGGARNRDVLLICSRCRQGSQTTLDFGCHGDEGLFHVGGVLGTRLEKGDVQLVRVFLVLSGVVVSSGVMVVCW